MRNKKTYKITDQMSYEKYLQELYVTVITGNATIYCSIEETLEAIAKKYGRTSEEAKVDIEQIIKLCSAVDLLLKMVAKEQFNST